MPKVSVAACYWFAGFNDSVYPHLGFDGGPMNLRKQFADTTAASGLGVVPHG